ARTIATGSRCDSGGYYQPGPRRSCRYPAPEGPGGAQVLMREGEKEARALAGRKGGGYGKAKSREILRGYTVNMEQEKVEFATPPQSTGAGEDFGQMFEESLRS